MTDQDTIQKIAGTLELHTEGLIVKGTEAARQFYVVIGVSRDVENRQVPSNKRLVEAQSLLLAEGISVEFLLTDQSLNDVEAGLRATLLHAFGQHVRNAFMTVAGRSAHVWYEQKRSLEEPIETAIRAKVEAYLAQLELSLSTISPTAGENLPTPTACASAIRQLAPAALVGIEEELKARGFTVPSRDWLNRRLDAMRKSGRIVRTRAGLYALSLTALQQLGTKKQGNSPDVSRVLALARRVL